MKFSTWNIDTNLSKAENGPGRKCFPMWRIKNRTKMICDHIKKENPDIINLQEIRKTKNKFGEEVNSLDPIIIFLTEHNYIFLSKGYNPDEMSFKFITAVKEKKFKFISNERLYLSKTPEKHLHVDMTKLKSDEYYNKIKDHNFGELWARSLFIVKMKCIATDDLFFVLNVHLGLSHENKFTGTKFISKQLNKIHTEHPKAKLIMSGDFNTFPEDHGDQLKTLNDLKFLTNASKKIGSTFISFPYDFGSQSQRLQSKSKQIYCEENVKKCKKMIISTFKNECYAKGGQLDHIFTSNLKLLNGKVKLSRSPQYKPHPKKYSEKEVKKYILENINNGPAFASDHQMLCASFK